MRGKVAVDRQETMVEGLSTSYLVAGEGTPLLLLHALEESAFDWRWVMPELSRNYLVYAPDLPGFGDSAKPTAADYSSAFFERFTAAFLDALGIERVAVVGNSLGGLIALRLALSTPDRVRALGLVSSAGLGREITPALLSTTLPGYGELAISWGKTPLGASQRAWGRVPLLFGDPTRLPAEWIAEQYRLARSPGYLEANIAALRAQLHPFLGQREVLLDQLHRLQMPTLVVWGMLDRVIPCYHARAALARLKHAHLELIPNCGHLPQVERPDRFVAPLGTFLDAQISG
jgi:pimeloyl-ACP methyl ester carboxylesterase